MVPAEPSARSTWTRDATSASLFEVGLKALQGPNELIATLFDTPATLGVGEWISDLLRMAPLPLHGPRCLRDDAPVVQREKRREEAAMFMPSTR